MFGVALHFLFLLTCGVTLGQEHGAVRVVVPEGGDAVLPLSIGRGAERDYFEWSRVGPGGRTLHEVFKYDAGDHYYNNGQPGQSQHFKGRVSHFPSELEHGNASILIRKTTAADAGNYTCVFPRLKPSLTFYFNLAVGAVRVVVLEGGEALFPVSIGMNAERLLFDWKKVGPGGGTLQEVFIYDAGIHYNNGRNGQSEQFKGRVSHFPAELKNGNAAIVIRKTTAVDRGNYTCSFPRLQPPQTFYFELDVAAAPKPSITILNATSDRALLQCEVPGASLNTKAEWQSRDGNRLEAEEKRVPEEDHVFISLSVNVTRTDLYLCVVSQEDIKHRASAQIYVFISEKQKKMESKECYSTAAMLMVGLALVVLGAVILAGVLALLVFGKCIKLHNKGTAEKISMGNGFSNGTNGRVRVPLEESLRPVE